MNLYKDKINDVLSIGWKEHALWRNIARCFCYAKQLTSVYCVRIKEKKCTVIRNISKENKEIYYSQTFIALSFLILFDKFFCF